MLGEKSMAILEFHSTRGKNSINDSNGGINIARKKFKPIEFALGKYDSATIPGEERFTSRANTSYARTRMASMRYTLLQVFRRQDGERKGLFFGIVWGDGGLKRYVLAMVRIYPSEILATPMTAMAYYGYVNSACGTFWLPHLPPLNPHGRFEGKSICLLYSISQKQSACYPLYISTDENGVLFDDIGWLLELETTYEILSQADSPREYDSRVAKNVHPILPDKNEVAPRPVLPQWFVEEEEEKKLEVRAHVVASNNAFGGKIAAPPHADSDCPPNEDVVDDVMIFNVKSRDRNVKKEAIALSDVNGEDEMQADGVFDHGNVSCGEIVQNLPSQLFGPDAIEGRVASDLDSAHYWEYLGRNDGRVFARWSTSEIDSIRKRMISFDKLFRNNGGGDEVKFLDNSR